MKIVTISREYGAGGHTIGRTAAEKLGIEFYDKDIIKETARVSGISTDDIEGKEEILSRLDAFIRGISPASYDQRTEIFELERAVILGFARKGPCVVLGRCADAILAEAGIEAVNVFLYADEKVRVKRACELLNTTDEAAAKRELKSIDYGRRLFYKYYTDKEWGNFHNYDLMINTGKIGVEKSIQMICDAAGD